MEFYIDETNADFGPVVRWNSSNQIPFNDMLTKFLNEGLIDTATMYNSMDARSVEAEIAIRKYIEKREQYGYSDEEKFEMQAAFGDEEVIDIFTGKRVEF